MSEHASTGMTATISASAVAPRAAYTERRAITRPMITEP
jgi:hypothetical protein